METNLLTDLDVKRAEARDKPYRLVDGQAMYLQVNPSGGKCWRLKYRFDGVEKVLALGVYPDVTLARAREKRQEARSQIADGGDPMQARRDANGEQAAERRSTFEGAADAYYRHHVNEWSATHARDITRILDELKLRLGARPLARITFDDVDAALAPIIARDSLTYARDVLMYFRCVLKHANAARVKRGGKPLADPSAFVEIPKGPKVQHHKAIPYSQAGEFLHRLSHATATPQTRIATRLLLFTGLRTTELRLGRWQEIDTAERLWSIPGERMKSGAPHVVGLSSQVLALLADLRLLTGGTGPEGLLFPNVLNPDEPISDGTILHTVYSVGYKGKLSPHGFRSMMADWANQKGGYRADVVEKQLSHAARDKVRAAYVRDECLPERRLMMDAWGSYLATSEHEAATRVVSIEHAAEQREARA